MNLAPNGKPSNLTAEQYKLVRTPAFKKWFGDWENDPKNASKVVDENGEPLVCYHATIFDFTIFKKDKPTIGVYGQGFYFTNDKEFASNYAKGESAKILSCFLNVRKTFEINNDELPSEYEKYSDMAYNKGKSRGFTDKIKSLNYDGVYSKNEYNENEIVVFEPNQIKLADGTNTTFDANNNDIRYKEGGNLTDELSLVLRGVTNENKYKGNYKKIFDIIENEIVFYNPYGTEKEELVGDNFYITITPRPENKIIEKISKLKNVEVINQNFKTGGTTKAFAYSIGGL